MVFWRMTLIPANPSVRPRLGMIVSSASVGPRVTRWLMILCFAKSTLLFCRQCLMLPNLVRSNGAGMHSVPKTVGPLGGTDELSGEGIS